MTKHSYLHSTTSIAIDAPWRAMLRGSYDPEPVRFWLDHKGGPLGFVDSNGHGTRCVSLIGSRYRLAPGLAPRANVLSLNVAGPDGEPKEDRIVAALRYARKHADVISCSFIVRSPPPNLLQAADEAFEAGVPVIAAAGNEAEVQATFPETTPNVVVVAGLDSRWRVLDDARLTEWIDIGAPGAKLRALSETGRVDRRFGHSSGATAIASAIVGLYLSLLEPVEKRRAAGKQIGTILKQTAREVDGVAFGRTDPVRMISLLEAFQGGIT